MRGLERFALSGVVAGLAVVGCASGRAGAAGAGIEYGASSAESAVAEFLDGVGRRDYAAMARLFGTPEGPAERRWGRIETEQRMFVLAGLLAYRSYGLRPLPVGEDGGRARWIADMTGTRRGSVSVPFIVAPHRGRWFVERILTESLGGS